MWTVYRHGDLKLLLGEVGSHLGVRYELKKDEKRDGHSKEEDAVQ